MNALSVGLPGREKSSVTPRWYLACASPDFVARHFPSGPTADALIRAPHMRFDRRDDLQARWAMQHGGAPVGAAVHWIPSTRAFLDLGLRGLACGACSRKALPASPSQMATSCTPKHRRLFDKVDRDPASDACPTGRHSDAPRLPFWDSELPDAHMRQAPRNRRTSDRRPRRE